MKGLPPPNMSILSYSQRKYFEITQHKDAIAKQLKEALLDGVKLCIVHGAGSFGHSQARKYSEGLTKALPHPSFPGSNLAIVGQSSVSKHAVALCDAASFFLPPHPCSHHLLFHTRFASPLADTKRGFKKGQNAGAEAGGDGILGFADVRRSVTLLNHTVVTALVSNGIPAVAMHPFPAWACSSGELVVKDGIHDVRQAMEVGFVPVLHGDAVLDSNLGCTILGYDARSTSSNLRARNRIRDASQTSNIAPRFQTSP